ncbi:uncharacterized protein LOC126323937 isoform X2 [Schistocerca gregaria]|uniref:uncharacterized protein LOC126323937 isoform X2 n=1 Tax=Schistocerca gregaria TaxID=7010 RepID=UPI00211DE864|nr:uncharacterized protein LOC126323937 isoform X2 [Schistocerca gregaria]
MMHNFLLIGCFIAILSVTQASMSASEFVHSKIQEHPVVVFSKSTCPYCRRAKELFTEHSVKFEAFELDQMDNGSDIRTYLTEITGQTTVPNIFINGEFVGGCDKLVAASKNGSLKTILTNANVSFQGL